ncbi:hypothetical protein [Labrys monachus]|uniref:Uncharacterized protein n=1 Tax=Labrys monachus TaxID=217067 RepID=A0ABU0FJ28_9HYPH|nr:hypothetical protein [Labrys monachus]MDQ0394615.1 hypothetical protein [Labrys monachus]
MDGSLEDIHCRGLAVALDILSEAFVDLVGAMAAFDSTAATQVIRTLHPFMGERLQSFIDEAHARGVDVEPAARLADEKLTDVLNEAWGRIGDPSAAN